MPGFESEDEDLLHRQDAAGGGEQGEALMGLDEEGGQLGDRMLSYEDAIDIVGVGKYQRYLALLCGWANASDAIELLAISFVITTTAECDLELTNERKGWVTSGLFVGMMIGGWMWGSLSDLFGRRKSLIVSLFVNSFFGFMSALATNYSSFLFCRIVSGIGVGGSIPIVFTYFCEFLPSKNRGAYMSIVAAFWMIGTIFSATLAWSIIGNRECERTDIQHETLSERCEKWDDEQCGLYGSIPAWRIFLACSSLPALFAALLMVPAPESPKWQLSVGRTALAEDTLNRMKRYTASVRKEDFTPILLAPIHRPDDRRIYPMGSPVSVRLKMVFGEFFTSIAHVMGATKQLFKPDTIRSTLVLMGVWFSLSFGFYGLSLWLPHYFEHGGVDDNVDIYQMSFFVALSNLPGNIFATWAVEKLGRRKTMAVSMALSGICVFMIPRLHKTSETVAFSCIFSAVSVAGWNTLDILSTEMFTTALRGCAFGLLAAMGRIGAIMSNLVFGEVSESNATLPLILTGFSLATGALICFLLPETAGTKLH